MSVIGAFLLALILLVMAYIIQSWRMRAARPTFEEQAHKRAAAVLERHGHLLEKPPPRVVARAVGNGSFSVAVVGESHYQDAIEAAVGGRPRDGADDVVDAVLAFEDDNAHDPSAVRVVLGGRTAGYLSREHARQFRKQVGVKAPGHSAFVCKARVRGGWDRGPRDRGNFGIWLDLDTGGGSA